MNHITSLGSRLRSIDHFVQSGGSKSVAVYTSKKRREEESSTRKKEESETTRARPAVFRILYSTSQEQKSTVPTFEFVCVQTNALRAIRTSCNTFNTFLES